MNHLDRHTRRIIANATHYLEYCTGCDWDNETYGSTFSEHTSVICHKCGFPWNDEELKVDDEHTCTP